MVAMMKLPTVLIWLFNDAYANHVDADKVMAAMRMTMLMMMLSVMLITLVCLYCDFGGSKSVRVRLATDDADNGDAGDDNDVGVHDDNDDDDRRGNP